MAAAKDRLPSQLRPYSTLIALLAAAILLALTKLAIDALPFQAGESPYLGIWLRVWVFVLTGLGAMLAWRIRQPEIRLDVLTALIALGLAGIVLLGLKNTSFGLNGIGGDQGLQTAQVTKFASYPGAVDFAYKGLPPFYPPAYFLALGKTAALLGIEPYRMLKFGLMAVAFALPFLLRFFWRWAGQHSLTLAALLSTLLYQDWYKPYEWLALVLFVPWWLHFIDGIGAKPGRRQAPWLLVGSAIGALLFTTYYYWFFIGAVALLIRFALRNAAIGDETDQQRNTWFNRLTVLAGSALLSVPYWGAMLASMAASGGWSALQNRYFVDEFAILQFPFLDLTPVGVALLGGLVYLLVTFPKSRLSFGLLNLVVAAYGWQLLGYLAFLLDVPLLTFKAREVVLYVLGLSALLAAGDLAAKIWRSAALRKRYASLFVGAAAVAALVYGQALATGFAQHPLLPAAQQARVPREFLDEFRAAAGTPLEGQVVWADGSAEEISIFLPPHQFLSWAAVFSHPAGQYYQRVEFLTLLSKAEDPGLFAAALMNNRYDHIDHILLLPVEGGYSFGYLPEVFPAPTVTEHIFFPDELFDPAYFEDSGMAGEFQVFTPVYANNPLTELPEPASYDPAARIAGIGDGDDLQAFLQRFGAHLFLAEQDAYQDLLNELYGD